MKGWRVIEIVMVYLFEFIIVMVLRVIYINYFFFIVILLCFLYVSLFVNCIWVCMYDCGCIVGVVELLIYFF